MKESEAWLRVAMEADRMGINGFICNQIERRSNRHPKTQMLVRLELFRPEPDAYAWWGIEDHPARVIAALLLREIAREDEADD